MGEREQNLELDPVPVIDQVGQQQIPASTESKQTEVIAKNLEQVADTTKVIFESSWVRMLSLCKQPNSSIELAHEILAEFLAKRNLVERTIESLKPKVIESYGQAAGSGLDAIGHEVKNVGFALYTTAIGLSRGQKPSAGWTQKVNQRITCLADILTQKMHAAIIEHKAETAKTEAVRGVIDGAVSSAMLQTEFDFHGLPDPVPRISDTVDLDIQIVKPTALQLLVAELIINARKAIWSSQQGNQINVTLSGDKRQIDITVTDNGPGIPPEQLHRVLQPGFSTHQLGPQSGSGLGITGNLKNLQQTYPKSWIDDPPTSTVGKGTTFNLHVPLQTAAEIELDQSASPPEPMYKERT